MEEEAKNQMPVIEKKVRKPRAKKSVPTPVPESLAPKRRQRKPKEAGVESKPKVKRVLSEAQRLALERGRAKMIEKALEKKSAKSEK